MTRPPSPLKVLAIHGFRTSGEIFFMQTAALRHATGIECIFIDAPFEASGPPDELIGEIYADYRCWEWYCSNTEDHETAVAQMKDSLAFLTSYIAQNGPFDGILGFSQGTAMVTMLLDSYQQTQQTIPFGFAVCIGGVEPSAFTEHPLSIALPSLHLIGEQDSYQQRSRTLASWYKDSTVMTFNEGHNIPSMRTGLYPAISSWLQAQSSKPSPLP